jgi:hypothetical protein
MHALSHWAHPRNRTTNLSERRIRAYVPNHEHLSERGIEPRTLSEATDWSVFTETRAPVRSRNRTTSLSTASSISTQTRALVTYRRFEQKY